MDLEYLAESEEEARKLMDACIASYDQFLKDNFQKDTRDVITFIGKARDELSKELKELEHAYLEFRKQNPSLTGSSEGHSFAARRLEQWDQAASLAHGARATAQDTNATGQEIDEGRGGHQRDQRRPQSTGRRRGDRDGHRTRSGRTRAEPVADDHTLDGGTYEQIADQLADVEYRRRSTERLIEHFRSQQAALAEAKPLSEKDVAFAFYADPDVRTASKSSRRPDRDTTTRLGSPATLGTPRLLFTGARSRNSKRRSRSSGTKRKRPSRKVFATIKKTKRSGNQKLTW